MAPKANGVKATTRRGSEIEKFLQRRAYVLLKRLWQRSEIAAEQRVVPRKNLVNEDVTVASQPARPFRNSHAQREGLGGGELRRQGENDRAFQSPLRKFSRLDGEAWTLFAGLGANPRLEIDNIKVPADRRHVSRASVANAPGIPR